MQAQEQYECFIGFNGYKCGIYFQDYFDEEMFSNFDVNDPSFFDFTSNGQNVPNQSPDIVLGQTYDSATLTTPAACGDDRDKMIGEYRTNNTPYLPACADFTTSSPDTNWTFAQMNSGNFTWAIIGSYFTTGLDSVKADVGSLTINSAYRDPAAERRPQHRTVHIILPVAATNTVMPPISRRARIKRRLPTYETPE